MFPYVRRISPRTTYDLVPPVFLMYRASNRQVVRWRCVSPRAPVRWEYSPAYTPAPREYSHFRLWRKIPTWRTPQARIPSGSTRTSICGRNPYMAHSLSMYSPGECCSSPHGGSSTNGGEEYSPGEHVLRECMLGKCATWGFPPQMEVRSTPRVQSCS